MNTGQTWETSLETDDSEIPATAPKAAAAAAAVPPNLFQRLPSPCPLPDHSLCRVPLHDLLLQQQPGGLDVVFRSSADRADDGEEASAAATAPGEGSDDDDDDDDKDSIAHLFLKPTCGPTMVDKQATINDGTTSNDVTIHFFLRLPNAASMKQQQTAKVERAERTADFMETAKALSLRLVRNGRGRCRQPQRSASSASRSGTTSALFATTTTTLGRQPSFRSPKRGCRVAAAVGTSASGGLEGMTDSLRRVAPPGRTASHGADRRGILEATPGRTASDGCGGNNDDGVAKFSPQRHLHGHAVAPFPTTSSPLGRANSIDGAKRLLEKEQRNPRRSPLRLGSKLQQLQQERQQQETHEVSLLSPSEEELAVQKQLLGYEDIYVPLKTGQGDVAETAELGSGRPGARSEQPPCCPSSAPSGREHAGEGGGGAEIVATRKQRRRVQRRSSFVAGSKIEQFDDNSLNHRGPSNAVYMNASQDEHAGGGGGGGTRRYSTRRPSLSSGSMSIESYNEWKIEMMAHNG